MEKNTEFCILGNYQLACVEEPTMQPQSPNHFRVIVDKWYEDRRAEEIKELNEYDESVDTYENFVTNLYEYSYNSTQYGLFTGHVPEYLPGDVRDLGPDQVHQQRMVNLANGIRWLFDFVDS
ncbi:unnamed protein product [Hermetia illucens]|uniref:Uncharacterized protein n=1 Tax=Hermetia illucens TaxID=343691 RepID=A0A7R8YPS3_HERIL|nr:unnamed protein product [Hermetia illucens]